MIDITKAKADAEEGLRIAEKATPGPWLVWASQPDVVVQTTAEKVVANVDTWTGRGVLDGDFIADTRTRAPEAYRNVIEMAGVIDSLNRRLGEVGELYGMALFDNERLVKERDELRAEVDRLRPLDETVRRQRERDETIEQGSR